jgi:hypothetical protein
MNILNCCYNKKTDFVTREIANVTIIAPIRMVLAFVR